ncbi:hypothetical protein BD324DRAFT_679780 [Kockovaella imperatae]|uniref:C3H1-type domain-containing protein n=1 Tax=Kockovaella imperatae TaxID=4999 RepID=A0A1Y1UP60_9TREE|nr:hypothetical protein BD324DRAFT_679780 [Kockovaella imperatae]ORX39304.1 hypothetical protein BD324DRAFT_679780 [Kockovaella imperatae]
MSSSEKTTGSPSASQSSVLGTYPHLAHYIFQLLSSATPSPTRATLHPLSISSSGESDEEDTGASTTADQDEQQDDRTAVTQKEKVELTTPKKKISNGDMDTPNNLDREALVKRVVDLLDNDEEDQVKTVLKAYLGELGKDEILMDQVCLDCMHRRRDDKENVPYNPSLTPARMRGSPATTAVPLRPYTPSRVPSFRALTPLGRPQSPSSASFLPGSGANTPTIPHTASSLSRPAEAGLSPSTSSSALPSSSSAGSPGLSPRMLNAKAASFSPSPRVVSATTLSKTAMPSPSDPWKDIPTEPVRSASPFGAVGPPMMTRSSSNLAIAAPLFSDQSSPFHSPLGTPNRGNIKIPDVFASPALLQRTSSRNLIPDDDDDDEFSPFGSSLPKLHHHDSQNHGLNHGAKPFEPFGNLQTPAGTPGLSDNGAPFDSPSLVDAGDGSEPYDDAGSGMTPLDVLASVFSSVPRSELEDALHRSGYDFESAMAMLVAAHTLPRSGSSTPQRVASPRPLLGIGGRGAMPLNQHAPREGYFNQGGRSYSGNMSPGLSGTRSPGVGPTRMCRYFLAGECRRSDCRFSHDLDRALCRFWLRGHCAKGPNCEFLHQLPNGLDPNALSSAMSRLEMSNDGPEQFSPNSHHPPDEFPDLHKGRGGGGTRGGRFDPTRNRFANAVKRNPVPLHSPSLQITGARHSPLHHPAYSPSTISEPRLAPVAVPRPSHRIKLRPPTLLPTLRTGSSTNEQYLTARATAIRLGQARNACLARAADAFRRGDGAAAKRFSREGKTLNERMLQESASAAEALIRERMIEVQKTVRERDPMWSDDPLDRLVRGRECGGGLGVILGVASTKVAVGQPLSAEERTECIVDLHTLHGNEGADLAGNFLAELERENYHGLAYLVVGEEKHVASQDPLRGASKIRLASSVKQFLAEWSYPWNESGGVICVDPCRS